MPALEFGDGYTVTNGIDILSALLRVIGYNVLVIRQTGYPACYDRETPPPNTKSGALHTNI